MASSLMHMAVARKIIEDIDNPDLFTLGCVLVDAAGQESHFRALAKDGRKIYDLGRFREEYADRLLTDDFTLGYYMHLVQDMLYRTFVYQEHGWNPRLPGNVDRLYEDYRMLNARLAKEYDLKPLTLPDNLKGHPLLSENAGGFLDEMRSQFDPVDEGDYFFLTPQMAEEYIDRAAKLCREELSALRRGMYFVDPMDYAYGKQMQPATIRAITESEYPLMRDFLYEAIFQRDENNLLPRNVVDNPELRVYIDDFGKKPQDFALCAEEDGQVVGMVWVRDIPAYGHVADGVPEFAVSVLKPYRGKGVGTMMMREMIAHLRAVGCPRATLAVQKDNYALRMYKKCGFEIIGENDQEYIMEIRL